MGLWARISRSSGQLMVGPLSFSLSPVSKVPMVPNLVTTFPSLPQPPRHSLTRSEEGTCIDPKDPAHSVCVQ
jgi:hypothetical protein